MPEPSIAAIATAPGRGGIGVVRVSGADLAPMAQAILGKCPPPRQAVYQAFRDASGALIDRGIALYFPAPHSYTGEDVLELQAHGGPAVLQLLLQRCMELGARLAQPGEFTRRAYLNDKLDLAQAEAVADVIEAATAEAARSAVRSLTGEFSGRIRALRDKLVELRMHVEACLDFPEEDLDFAGSSGVADKLAAATGELEGVLAGAKQGNLLREGMHVVLIGRPNVGKSSLLNRLSGEEVAIVTAVPGTTRDTIKAAIQIEGVPLHVIDTAGLRETQDEVEHAGIARTWKVLEGANVALLLLDAARGQDKADRAILQRLPPSLPVVRVFNKIDLAGEVPRQEESGGMSRIYLSAKTGDGVELLRAYLLKLIGWQAGGEGMCMARERHLRALAQVQLCLQRAAANLAQPELLAEELRLAQQALNEITGEFTSDDLLGEIFSRFCIGK